MSNTDQDPSALTGIDELRFESGANSKPSRDPYLAALSRKPLNLNIIGTRFPIAQQLKTYETQGPCSKNLLILSQRHFKMDLKLHHILSFSREKMTIPRRLKSRI
jgi:hypothetical protein